MLSQLGTNSPSQKALVHQRGAVPALHHAAGGGKACGSIESEDQKVVSKHEKREP